MKPFAEDQLNVTKIFDWRYGKTAFDIRRDVDSSNHKGLRFSYKYCLNLEPLRFMEKKKKKH